MNYFNPLVAISNALTIGICLVLLYAFFRYAYHPWRFSRIKFKLFRARDRADRLAYLDGRIVKGGFIHRYTSYIICVWLREAENIRSFWLIEKAQEESGESTEEKLTTRLYSRFVEETSKLDPETLEEIREIHREITIAVSELLIVNNNFLKFFYYIWRVGNMCKSVCGFFYSKMKKIIHYLTPPPSIRVAMALEHRQIAYSSSPKIRFSIFPFPSLSVLKELWSLLKSLLIKSRNNRSIRKLNNNRWTSLLKELNIELEAPTGRLLDVNIWKSFAYASKYSYASEGTC